MNPFEFNEFASQVNGVQDIHYKKGQQKIDDNKPIEIDGADEIKGQGYQHEQICYDSPDDLTADYLPGIVYCLAVFKAFSLKEINWNQEVDDWNKDIAEATQRNYL